MNTDARTIYPHTDIPESRDRVLSVFLQATGTRVVRPRQTDSTEPQQYDRSSDDILHIMQEQK